MICADLQHCSATRSFFAPCSACACSSSSSTILLHLGYTTPGTRFTFPGSKMECGCDKLLRSTEFLRNCLGHSGSQWGAPQWVRPDCQLPTSPVSQTRVRPGCLPPPPQWDRPGSLPPRPVSQTHAALPPPTPASQTRLSASPVSIMGGAWGMVGAHRHRIHGRCYD